MVSKSYILNRKKMDGRVVGHIHVAIIIAGSLAARLLLPAARLHGRMTCRITGLRNYDRKPSEISEKGHTQSSTLATRVHVQELHYRKPARAARRGGACNGGK